MTEFVGSIQLCVPMILLVSDLDAIGKNDRYGVADGLSRRTSRAAKGSAVSARKVSRFVEMFLVQSARSVMVGADRP